MLRDSRRGEENVPIDILRWLTRGYGPSEQNDPLKSSMSRVHT